MSTTTFIVPTFNKGDEGKVHKSFKVPSEHVLLKSCDSEFVVPAIASEGFPDDRDGTYVFVTSVDDKHQQEEGAPTLIQTGFTSTECFDSNAKMGYPGAGGMNGACVSFANGRMVGGEGEISKQWHHHYFHAIEAQNAKEIVSILTISQKGAKRSIQIIFDGTEGRVINLESSDFENENGGSEIFPIVAMHLAGNKIECIPFNHVKSRSPRIDQLMKEFFNQRGNDDDGDYDDEDDDDDHDAETKDAPPATNKEISLQEQH